MIPLNTLLNLLSNENSLWGHMYTVNIPATVADDEEVTLRDPQHQVYLSLKCQLQEEQRTAFPKHKQGTVQCQGNMTPRFTGTYFG